MKRLLCSAALLVALGVTLGCDKKVEDVKRVKVSGIVKLDDKPVQTGTITFDAQNGQPPASLDILDGKYEGMAAIGKNKVTITATRKVNMKEKMKMDGPGYDKDVEENIMPNRYNVDSTISREVTEAGPNEFNFDTTSSK